MQVIEDGVERTLTTDELMAHLRDDRADREAAYRVKYATTMQERWDALRQFYSLIDTRKNDPRGIDVDWQAIFTPIESFLWEDIRTYGLPFWPQYPACGVFFDFADPYKKIAVEADGKQWHDRSKDAERDARVLKQGWQVYRVSGSDCWRSESTLMDMQDSGADREEPEKYQAELERFARVSSTALIEAIRTYYYDEPLRYLSDEQVVPVLRRRCLVGGPPEPPGIWAGCL